MGSFHVDHQIIKPEQNKDVQALMDEAGFPRFRWLTGALVVLGFALCALPTAWQTPHAAHLAELLAPGQRIFISMKSHFAQTWNSQPDSHNSQQVTKENYQLALVWAENKRLRSMIQQLEHAPGLELQQVSSPPLLQKELVRGRILSTQQASRWKKNLTLDRQHLPQIKEGDFVIHDRQLLLDVGSQDHIAAESLVLTGTSVLGVISKTGPQTSQVRRMNDPEFRGSARLVRISAQGPIWGAVGSIHGTGQETCLMEYVPTTEPVAIGDLVVVVDPQSMQFMGAVYGRVQHVQQVQGSSHWKIDVTPACTEDVATLESAWVLTEKLNASRILQTTHQEPLLEKVPGP